MNPYRQPQRLDERPADPTRIILIVAGVVAALIAVAAIVFGVTERLTREDPTMPIVRAPPKPTPIIPTPDIVKQAPQRPPQPLPDEGPLAFMTGTAACSGDCIPHTTWIMEDGRVVLTPGRKQDGCALAERRVSQADLAALAAHARSIHMETMPWSFIHGHNVGSFLTKVTFGADQLVVYHFDVAAGADASANDQQQAAIASLHRHIERLAGTERWLKTCKR